MSPRVALSLIPVALVAGLSAGFENPRSPGELEDRCVAEIDLGVDVHPAGLAVDGGERIWLADTLGNRLVELDVASLTTTSHALPDLSQPHGLAIDGDGTVWFGGLADRIGRFDPSTGETEIFRDGISRGAQPHQVAIAPDGTVYFSEQGLGRLGRLDPATGEITEMSEGLPRRSRIHGLVLDGDGGLWTALQGADRLARFDLDTGAFDRFVEFSGRSGPHEIALGGDGRLYVTLQRSSGIGIADPETGDVIELETGIPEPLVSDLEPAPKLEDVVAGPDGRSIWVTTSLADRLLRLDLDTGRIEYVSCGIAEPAGLFEIAAAPDGTLWFSELVGGRIARLSERPSP